MMLRTRDVRAVGNGNPPDMGKSRGFLGFPISYGKENKIIGGTIYGIYKGNCERCFGVA